MNVQKPTLINQAYYNIGPHNSGKPSPLTKLNLTTSQYLVNCSETISSFKGSKSAIP